MNGFEDVYYNETKGERKMSEVKHLAINYKTAEDFKKFREYGAQELQMVKELEGNMIDANMDSPFYGIYVGDTLAARMCLYRRRMNMHRSSILRMTIWSSGSLKSLKNTGDAASAAS